MKRWVCLFLVFISPASFALEIDQKLTLRILKTSTSKKTILVNRGIEDGLVKGDHAKFFLSIGVVARGVVIQISPTKSVWSLYRLVNAASINVDQVMNLKITAPVKITTDESRMLVTEDISGLLKDPRDLGIPLAQGADDLNNKNNNANAVIINAKKLNLNQRNKEIFGSFSYSQASAKTTSSNSDADASSALSNIALLAGFELYFKEESKWYHRVSLSGMFKLNQASVMAYQGSTIDQTTSEFGGGAKIYPGTRPSQTTSLIPYLGASLFIGTSQSKFIFGTLDNQDDKTLDAASVAYEFLFGYKYYTEQAIGIFTELGYRISGDSYVEDSENDKWVLSQSGPRFFTGLSYRF